MKASNIGVCECFFGPSWSLAKRFDWATYLAQKKMNFFLYGPKEDPYLRKRWTEDWSAEYQNKLSDLVQKFHACNIKVGVAFSPYGLTTLKDPMIKEIFIKKIELLSQLKFDSIGLFFDDMNYVEGLLETQLEILEIARRLTSSQIIFCPTYYTYDPILDKVFGKRPENYLQTVGNSVHKDIDICWTGPKVISPEITDEHLIEVTQVLKRKPMIFDNFFANDGPKNCKFLKFKPLIGRSTKFIENINGLVFNPMNQSYLSKIVVGSAMLSLTNSLDPQENFKTAVQTSCSKKTSEVILQYQNLFLTQGLDNMTESIKMEIIKQLEIANDDAAVEMLDWLSGKYTVGAECLTD